jgi:hypothetical protein
MSPDTGSVPSVLLSVSELKAVPSAFVDVATTATVGTLVSEKAASVAGVLAVFAFPALSVKPPAATPSSIAAAVPDTAAHVTVTTHEVASSHDAPASVKLVASQLVLVDTAVRSVPIGFAVKPTSSVMVNVNTTVGADVGTVLSVAVSEKLDPSAFVPTTLLIAISGAVVSSHVLAGPVVILVYPEAHAEI